MTMSRDRRALLPVAFLLTAGMFSLLPLLSARGADDGADLSDASPTVIELFTSQGCSSCPPADALLETYKHRSGVIALSFPVDYWDRLGWKDTYASRAHTDRQRDYARGRGDGEVYTPQVIVNGARHEIGSIARAIDGAISSTAKEYRASSLPLRTDIRDGHLAIDIGKSRRGSPDASTQVLVALVQDSGSVSIQRGENAGRRVTYHNVVRELRQVGTVKGAPISIRIPLSELSNRCCNSAVVLLQRGPGGPLVGARQVSLE